MKDIWDRIHAWLNANAPPEYGHLRPGASTESIRAAEKAMGLKLPGDVKASFRIHDGQDGEPGLIGGEGWMLSPLQEVVPNHLRCRQDNPRCAHRMPIAYIGTGDYVFLDLAPESDGFGSLMIQRTDRPDADPLARSFSDWLENFAEELEEDVFTYSEEDGELLLVDELEPV